jgi:hypothetical protein
VWKEESQVADTAGLAAASHLALHHVGELVGRHLRRNGDLNLNDEFHRESSCELGAVPYTRRVV